MSEETEKELTSHIESYLREKRERETSELKFKSVITGRTYTMEQAIEKALFERDYYCQGQMEEMQSDIGTLKKVVIKLLRSQITTIDQLNDLAGFQQFEHIEVEND
jgi:hypothetical protein